jgi:hypothetical protein
MLLPDRVLQTVGLLNYKAFLLFLLYTVSDIEDITRCAVLWQFRQETPCHSASRRTRIAYVAATPTLICTVVQCDRVFHSLRAGRRLLT